jgi:Holliday junction resolvase RusA-like endonuclease
MTTRSARFAHPEYFVYKNELKTLANRVGLTQLPSRFKIVFNMPIAPSNLKKDGTPRKGKSGPGQPHHQTPDVDNLVKAIFDALGKEKIVIKRGKPTIQIDDSYIYGVYALKKWCLQGNEGIEISEMFPEGELGQVCDFDIFFNLMVNNGLSGESATAAFDALSKNGFKVI